MAWRALLRMQISSIDALKTLREHVLSEPLGAGDGIRTHEHLRDWTLNPAPLTWLGNPRKKGSLSLALVVYNCNPKPATSRLRQTFGAGAFPYFLSLERNLSPLQLRERLLHSSSLTVGESAWHGISAHLRSLRLLW